MTLDAKPSQRRHRPRVLILDRYVAREFLMSYVVALVVVIGLRVLMDLFVEFDEFVEASREGVKPAAAVVLARIAAYYGPKVFEYFRDFSGAMIVLAALFSLARLTRQNELTAVLASGISLKRVVAPIVVLAIGLNLLMVVDQELVLPRLADKLVRKHDEMEQMRTLHVSLLPDRDGALFTARFDPNETISDVWILLRNKAGSTVGVLTASQGSWDAQEKAWRLADGRLRYAEAAGREMIEQVKLYRSDLSPHYLWLQRNSAYKSLMSSGQLTELIHRALRPSERAEAVAERHFRLTDPVINMVMLLMGLPLIVSRERRKTKTAVLLVALGSGGCFVATFACKLMAGSGIPPFLAAALPVIIFAPLSMVAVDTIKT